MFLDFSSYLKSIDRFLKDGHLAKACFEYSQAPGPVQRYLKNIYGLLITGGLPSERALSRTKYPAVLANKITRDFELLIEIVPKSRSNFYQWPEHLK
ncbi:MAG: hypothetical protein CL916_04905 [Deltaproteobacteria bacterium]|nr:hypothetical protein [Deltaproteobacteria bacterium]